MFPGDRRGTSVWKYLRLFREWEFKLDQYIPQDENSIWIVILQNGNSVQTVCLHQRRAEYLTVGDFLYVVFISCTQVCSHDQHDTFYFQWLHTIPLIYSWWSCAKICSNAPAKAGEKNYILILFLFILNLSICVLWLHLTCLCATLRYKMTT